MRNAYLMLALRAAMGSDASDDSITGGEIASLAVEAGADEEEETDQHKADRKARLATEEAKARKAANDGTAIPDELVGLAQREIKECWKEFAGTGGVWDLTQKVKSKIRTISQHILNIAKECAVHAYERCEGNDDADPIKLAGSMFRNAMASAELALRASLDLSNDDAEKQLDAFLSGSWNVYKSQVKSGFDAGFDPKDYDSIYAITKAIKAAKEAKSTGTRDDDKGDKDDTKSSKGSEAAMTVDEVADVVDGGSAPVHQAVLMLLKSVKFAASNAEHTDKVANILNLARREIDKLSMVKPGEQSAQPAKTAAEA
jgi:hypothetical protein